jgi:hypothetical protein
MKLRGLVPYSYIHVSLSDLHIPTIGQIHECRNWERGHAVTFLGILKSDPVCSALELYDRSFLLHTYMWLCRCLSFDDTLKV